MTTRDRLLRKRASLEAEMQMTGKDQDHPVNMERLKEMNAQIDEIDRILEEMNDA